MNSNCLPASSDAYLRSAKACAAISIVSGIPLSF
nr:MAG TPA: hypothetical protein [Crassvirales sp.]DAW89902.1 MAG TPA: hypothetical protein [Caudoviricetes sp.]